MPLLLGIAVVTLAASCAPADLPATPTPDVPATRELPYRPLPTLKPTLDPTAATSPSPGPEGPAHCPTPVEDVELAPDLIDENMASEALSFLNAGGRPSALEAALNAVQIQLDSEFYRVFAKVHLIDVTGDDLTEVIIEGKIPSIPYSVGVLEVYGCGPGVYELRFHYDNFFVSNELTILAIEDVNGTPPAEIIYSWRDLGATGGSFPMNYYVLGWDGASFVQLVQSDETPDGLCCAAVVYDSIGRLSHLEDLDADGVPELMLRSGAPGGLDACDAGPVRDAWWIWAWDGEAIALDRVLPDPPLYRFQAVQDGDRLTLEGRLEEALAAYQSAVFDESLEPGTRHYWVPRLLEDYCAGQFIVPPANLEERPQLEAYSRYRIVLVHVIQGDMAAAQVVYDTLQSKFPSGQAGQAYAELARVFWEQPQREGNPEGACAAAIEYARDHDDVLFSWSDWDYGWANPPPDPEEICPLPLKGAGV